MVLMCNDSHCTMVEEVVSKLCNGTELCNGRVGGFLRWKVSWRTSVVLLCNDSHCLLCILNK